MSEVIRDFIKDHEKLGEAKAFEQFLEQERIRAWVGDDPQRREKIRREFARIWATQEGEGQNVVQVQKPETPEAPPKPESDSHVPIHRGKSKAVVERPVPSTETGYRHLNLLCTNCDGLDVWNKGHVIECRGCGRVYDNMLELVPVQPVGPFTYLFGEGTGGVATAVGLVLLLLVIYGVFRWA